MNRVQHFSQIFQFRVWLKAELRRRTLFVPSIFAPNPAAPHPHRYTIINTRHADARITAGFFYGKNQREPMV